MDEAHDGQRIDNFLLGQLKGVPKSLVYRILRTGQVRINGKRAKPDVRIADGDEVRIPPVRTAEPAAHGTPARAQLERIGEAIIHEDRDFLVIDKPSGVASHGGSGISFGAIELLRAARPGDTLELAHRLDRDTSGVLVLTRRRTALTALQTLIRDNQTTKQYLTLLQGKFGRSTFDVNAPLRKSVRQGGERMVRVDDDGKAALTRFRAIDAFRDATLAEATLFTGRTHQIRVHSAHSGHPIAGDEKYGEREFNLRMREFGLRRLFLHAARFEFAIGDRTYSFSAPLADELRAVLNALPRASGTRATGKSAR
ncbi:MAG TPA: RluA family pseudouridine synthase [Rudaea sp.]|nr:RluA family pseudouridine synthase [Rudaea sp.]